MPATLVYVDVKPEFVNDFILATRDNHANSIREKGNFRFDVLQDKAEPTRFLLYEVYDSEEAVLAHKETAHYARWRDKVESWMAKPRQGVKHTLLFPEV